MNTTQQRLPPINQGQPFSPTSDMDTPTPGPDGDRMMNRTQSNDHRLLKETHQIKDRLNQIAQAHQDIYYNEKDVRRMVAMQFKELHKMLVFVVDKVRLMFYEAAPTCRCLHYRKTYR
jgi:hypothetical protein